MNNRQGKNVSLTQKAIIIRPNDNVATALTDLKAGEILKLHFGNKDLKIKLVSPIPFGHKFSLTNIKAGFAVVKYGETVGIATADIHLGDYVHTHNVVSARGRGDLAGER